MGVARWGRAFSFAFTRDPYARLVSCWAYAFGLGAPDPDRFRSWVRRGCPLHSRYRIDLGANRLVWMHDPQAEWITDTSGSLCVSRLVRLERSETDWPSVASEIGATPRLPRENVSDHVAVDMNYDDWSRGWVRERYALDFELLDYPT